ncbi:MAG: hypothetical protein KDB84_07185, partial [Flavobacteriales bacterium]|nr:hypothetical protein [Flavobacteriales bacterium]
MILPTHVDRPWKRPIALMWPLLLCANTWAQPICSINIGADHTICAGQTVQLQGPPGFPNYLWSTGAVTNSITVGTSGNYWCQVSYPVGNMVVNGDFSSGNTGFSTEFNYSTTLTTDGNYWIGTNAANYHPQFSGTGSGNFMIVNSGWPSALWRVWCQNVVVCPGQTYTLSYRARTLSNDTPARLQWWIDGAMVGPEVNLPAYGTGWQTITQSWTTGAAQTSASICLRVMSGDGVGNDFGLDDLSLTGTVVLTDDVEVFVTPLPVVDLGPDATLCDGQSLVLDAAVPGGTYVWQDASVASSYVVNGPGVYSVSVTANNCTASDAITVGYNPMPVVDFGPDTTLCDGQTLLLDATNPGATYTWQDASGMPTFTVSSAGTYSVNVALNGCYTSDAIYVGYNPVPLVDLGPDQTRCAGEQVVLDATTTDGTYQWQDNVGTATYTATTTGTYSVAVTVNGCTGTDAVDLTFNPLPTVDLGPDVTVCPGTPVTFDATTAGATYLWQDGSIGPTLTATAPGNYSVDVTVDGCTSTDNVQLTNFTLQVVDLGPDVTICQGASTALGVSVPGATYAWDTGETTNSITTGVAGPHWVDVTLNGCVVRDSVIVNVTPLPVVSLGPDRTICPGTSTVLDVTTPGATYLWNTGAMTPTISVGQGNYSVTVTVGGCSASDAITVNEFPNDPVALGNDTTLCAGASVTFDVFRPGASYLWHDGTVASSFTATSSVNATVALTDANGCTSTDAVQVTFVSPSTVFLGNDTALCPGNSLTLSAPNVPGAIYAWSTGANTHSIQVTNAGNYSVSMTQGPCVVTDAIVVSAASLPTVDLGIDVTL